MSQRQPSALTHVHRYPDASTGRLRSCQNRGRRWPLRPPVIQVPPATSPMVALTGRGSAALSLAASPPKICDGRLSSYS
jgi:hypothetical protein